MVYGPLKQWYSWTEKPEDQGRDRLYGGQHPYGDTLVSPPQILSLLLRQDEFIPSGFLIKREALQQGRVYEDQFREGYSDAVALVKICLTSVVYVSKECWYLYRKHPASSTYRSWLLGKDDQEPLMYFTWIAKYFEQQQVTDPELLQILRSKLWRCHHPNLSRWLSIKHYMDQLEQVIVQWGRRTLPLQLRQRLWTQWERFRRP
jgi:hypothetical protein